MFHKFVPYKFYVVYDEMSVRQNGVRTAKCPCGELSYGEMSYGEMSYGEMSYGELSYGEKSGNQRDTP